MATIVFDLAELAENGRLGLTPAEAGHLVESAAVIAEKAGNALPQTMQFSGRKRRKPRLTGPKLTQRMRRTYADFQEATEWGAEAVATLAIEKLENLTVYERSPKSGCGFDYFLVPSADYGDLDDENFFALATHSMEVSGTIQDDERELDDRVREKLKRLKGAVQALPTFIVVVDFKRVRAKVVKHA